MKKITAAVFSLVSLLTLIVFISGCATSSPKVQVDEADPTTLRQWTSKSQLNDKKKDRVHSLDIDFLAEGRQRLRLDVSGTWSVAVAAAVVNGDQMTCLLPRQKRFYQGPAGASALSSVMKVPLDPQVIYAILLDQSVKMPGWQCQSDSEGRPTSCENTKLGQTVKWLDRQGNRKKVVLDSESFELTLSLNEFPTKVQDRERAFTLNVPTEYKAVRQ